MIRSWLARKFLARTMRALNRGDIGPTLMMERPDVRFRFPGRSSWAIEATNRDQVADWLTRMVGIGLQHDADPEGIVVGGPPWRMTLALRSGDFALDSQGKRVYENRYVIWATLKWGRIAEYEVYEDTERVTAFDAYLASAGASPSPR